MGEHALIGAVLNGRYRVDAWIARGGYGAVYRATHLETGCDIAIKVLLTAHDSEQDTKVRFQREAEVLARLRDPHTVMTYEFGETPDGMLYIAMELLRGETLVQRLERGGALPWREAIAIARAVCQALVEAHGLGIVHRDLKPGNIHLERWSGGPEIVKVIDFGIVKMLRGSELEDDVELTHAGQAIGTPEYMAPEQITGGPIDDRADIYALGVVLYEMLVGCRPFAYTTDLRGLILEILERTPAAPSDFVELEDARLAADLDQLVLRCLERHSYDRFDGVAALANALDALELRADQIATSTRGHQWMLDRATLCERDDEATWLHATPLPQVADASGLAAVTVDTSVPLISMSSTSSLLPPCPTRVARGSVLPMAVFVPSQHAKTRSLHVPVTCREPIVAPPRVPLVDTVPLGSPPSVPLAAAPIEPSPSIAATATRQTATRPAVTFRGWMIAASIVTSVAIGLAML